MKNTIKIAIVALALAFTACKKNSPEPIESCTIPVINNQTSINIHYENVGSQASNKSNGIIMALNGNDTLFYKLFDKVYPSTYVFDTTFIVDAAHIQIKALMYQMYDVGGQDYELDYGADAQLRVKLNGEQKLLTYGTHSIAVDSYIK